MKKYKTASLAVLTEISKRLYTLEHQSNASLQRDRELSNAIQGVRDFSMRTQEEKIRRSIATHLLSGMIASSPVVDRTKVDKRKWAKVAYEFADALIAEGNKK